jgi:hypothetical protein
MKVDLPSTMKIQSAQLERATGSVQFPKFKATNDLRLRLTPCVMKKLLTLARSPRRKPLNFEP